MPRYKIKRTFPSRETLVRGSIVEDPAFRDVGQLVRTGYLELIPDEIAPDRKIDEIAAAPANISPPLAENAPTLDQPPPAAESSNVEDKTVVEEKTVAAENTIAKKQPVKAAPKSKIKPAAKK